MWNITALGRTVKQWLVHIRAREVVPDHSHQKHVVTDFEVVLQCEHNSINRRRRKTGRKPITDVSNNSAGHTPSVYDTVGLSLSGGGIRSAGISLGVLQALNKYGGLPGIDYLSTVSGGGYIGSSLTSTMTATSGKFIFLDEMRYPTTHTPCEPPESSAVAHLRNYSNYLLAGGKRNIGAALAILVRGLIANLTIVMPLILAASALMIFSHPKLSSFREESIMSTVFPSSSSSPFPITTIFVIAGILLFLGWALVLSFLPARRLSVESTRLSSLAAIYLVLVAAAFFIELQPYLIRTMLGIVGDSYIFFNLVLFLIYTLIWVALPFAIIVALFQRRLGAVLSRAHTTSSNTIWILANMGRIAIWIAAVEVPLLIWATFLNLSFWGVFIDEPIFPVPMSPESLNRFAGLLFGGFGSPVAMLYLTVGALLLLLSTALKPNALSLHGFYRDRLRSAFLFDPNSHSNTGYLPLTGMRVSDISTDDGPYQLINAALNIRGSSFANQRGRDFDFFLFSPIYVGSLVTGFVPMTDFEEVQDDLDLATAVPISGAAVSSTMGTSFIRPLRPTLALLNISLGYWLRNPWRLYKPVSTFRRAARLIAPAIKTLVSEMSAQLYAHERNEVYITDGGHIENLGIYELLRRRCRVIVCMDAEADPEMRFNSFMALQRYASIDLGIQIRLPWELIQSNTVNWMGHDSLSSSPRKTFTEPTSGPHAALGIIRYRNGQSGFLLYIKSSLTGDEEDYVRDYGRRHTDFPHEPTGKQFFNEEQFEVYRALGFHMTDGIFSGRDDIVEGHFVEGRYVLKSARFNDASNTTIKELREALFGSPARSPQP
jgi:Patatin-like phospholipase